MNYIKVPQKSDWKNFIKRQVIEQNEMEQLVKNCFETIQKTGDQAIKHFTYLFDNISLETFKVSPKEIETACESIDVALRDAIQLAAQNIEKFHASQIETINKIETTEGVTC
jgi:histidinol dehydrogenase